MARKARKGTTRNVVTGRSDGYTGRVPFPRLGVTTAYESLLARDFLLVTAAFERDIVEIHSEPMKLLVHLLGSASLYTPDYLIVRERGPRELIEVKPLKVVEPTGVGVDDEERGRLQDEADERFEAIETACLREGYVFRLLTEAQIRVEPRLSNAAFMLRHGDCFYPKAKLLAGREALLQTSPRSIRDLQAALPDLDALPLAVRLAWSGDLEIDASRPFTRDSGITPLIGRCTPDSSAN